MMSARIRLDDMSGLDILGDSLSPETTREMPRTKVDVRRERDALVIEVQAEDVSSLRAALNSYLRWLKLAIDTKEEFGVGKRRNE